LKRLGHDFHEKMVHLLLSYLSRLFFQVLTGTMTRRKRTIIDQKTRTIMRKKKVNYLFKGTVTVVLSSPSKMAIHDT